MPLVLGNEGQLFRLWQVSEARRVAPDAYFNAPATSWGADVWPQTGCEARPTNALVVNPAPWPIEVTLEGARGATRDRITGKRWERLPGTLPLPAYGMLVLEMPEAPHLAATARVPANVSGQLRKRVEDLEVKSTEKEAKAALTLARQALAAGRHVAAWEALQDRSLRSETDSAADRLLGEGRL